MKELTWESELDGAFCMGNSFAYFHDAGNRQFLEKVYRALKPEKAFLLQTNLVMESILTKPLSRTWYEFGWGPSSTSAVHFRRRSVSSMTRRPAECRSTPAPACLRR